MPLRVVLATNGVLSALVFGGGVATRLRLAWQQPAFVPLACSATAQELVRIPAPAPWVPQCRDPLGLAFMQLALAGKAQVLVTGDQDLLVLAVEFERLGTFRIVSLDSFLRPSMTDHP